MKDGEPRLIDFAACPVCSGKSLRPYKKGTFSGRLTQEHIKITDSQYGRTWDLSACRSCGHIFANPSPSPEFVLSLYGRVEDPAYEEEAAGRAKNFLRVLRALEKLCPQKGTVFDVGAATGIFLDLARRRGWRPEGVEPSIWAVKTAKEKYGLRVLEGSFETIPLRPNSCAAVTMVDFIEHTPAPFEAVRKAHDILSPSGILALVTPDIHSPAARIAGRRWWHFRPAHLAFFSRASLARLLERAGFSTVRERRYTWTFSAHYLLSRKDAFEVFLRSPFLASFLKRIPIKLAFGDSFEIYARKETR